MTLVNTSRNSPSNGGCLVGVCRVRPLLRWGFANIFFAEPLESVLCEEAEYRGGTAIFVALCRKTGGVFVCPYRQDKQERK